MLRTRFKNWILGGLCFILWAGWGWAVDGGLRPPARQDDIPLVDNPKTPANRNAGRILKLKEIYRITDEAGDFVFRLPRQIEIGDGDAIYVGDKGDPLGRGVVYAFRSGKFVKTLITIGQGPGEFPMGSETFLATGEEIVLLKRPDSLVWIKAEGQQIREVKTAAKIRRFFGYDPPYLIGATVLTSGIDRTNGVRTTYYPLKAFDEQGREIFLPLTLSTRSFFGYPENGGVFITPITEILTAFLPPHDLVFSQTTDYLVSVFDCAQRRLVRRFKRDYTPVKSRMRSRGIPGLPDVENDIQKLFVRRDEIWVLTSSEKDGKPLIDVFDRQGRYVDAFYLPVNAADLKDKYGTWYAMAIRDDFLYAVRTIDDGALILVKYAIEK